MRKKLILFLLLLTPLLYSCESIFGDDEPELPPITTTGEDTFGCKIDGKVFVPYFRSLMTNQSLFASDYYRQIEISAESTKWIKRNDDCPSSWLNVNFERDSNDNIKNQGLITFTECNALYPPRGELKFKADIFQNQGGDNSFEILKDERIDQYEVLLSGTFKAIAKSEDGQTRKITDGRFDVKMRKKP